MTFSYIRHVRENNSHTTTYNKEDINTTKNLSRIITEIETQLSVENQTQSQTHKQVIILDKSHREASQSVTFYSVIMRLANRFIQSSVPWSVLRRVLRWAASG